MTANVRIFASEEGARAADARLAQYGFDEREVILPSAAKGREPEAITEAVKNGLFPDRLRNLGIRSLKAGRGIVAVRASFGYAVHAVAIMEEGDTVDTDTLLSYKFDAPSPFSDALGWRTLVPYASTSPLVSNSWSLSGMFGLGLLSKAGDPLSRLFKMPTLSKPKAGGEWKSSMGMPLLTSNAAPLSSMFGLPKLTKSKSGKSWTSSFGFPMLTSGEDGVLGVGSDRKKS